MSTDNQIEAEIQAKGLTAPRVTTADIEKAIKEEHYYTAQQGVVGASISHGHACSDFSGNPLSLVTHCVLTLHNGFTVQGVSAVASPENFDAEIGKKVARQDAVSKLWPLLGFALKEKLFQEQQNPWAAEADEFKRELLHIGGLARQAIAEMTPNLQPHQRRVLIERTDLADKLAKLRAFIVTPRFETLPVYEQSLLSEQAVHMQGYLDVLEQRIKGFA